MEGELITIKKAKEVLHVTCTNKLIDYERIGYNFRESWYCSSCNHITRLLNQVHHKYKNPNSPPSSPPSIEILIQSRL